MATLPTHDAGASSRADRLFVAAWSSVELVVDAVAGVEVDAVLANLPKPALEALSAP